MSVEKWGWVSVTVTGSVAVALGAFLFVYANGLDSGQNQAVAAWVQAIGSVLAIVGAIGIATAQSHSARREKQVAIFAVVHAAVVEARRIRELLHTDDPELELTAKYHHSIIDSYFGALSNCPVHELHSPAAVTAHLMLRDQFSFLRKAIEICLAGPSRHPNFKREHEQLKDAYTSQENRRQLDDRIERQRQVLRRNVEVHIDAIEQRYAEMRHVARW